jgi:hypothetical protein
MDATKDSSGVKVSIPGSDVRAERLLSLCSDLEPYENRIAPDVFVDFIESAVFASGFHTVEEACESLIGPDLFRIWLKRCVALNKHSVEGVYR